MANLHTFRWNTEDGDTLIEQQQRRLLTTNRKRLARRDATPTADYWQGAVALPITPDQARRMERHILGYGSREGVSVSMCGVEPHVRAPLTLEAEAA